jgi:DNA-binding HxlR family transcriptional regulator
MADGQASEEAAKSRDEVLDLFDLLGRRWALRVIWELGTDGLTYRELAARIPDMSTSSLTQRLRDLRAAHLVEHERGSGYRLTALGADLLVRLQGLQEWASRVGFAFGPADE